MEKKGITQSLAEFVSRTGARAIPEETLHAAKRCLLDWVGVALAGSRHRAVPMLLDVLGAAPSGEVKILGRPERLDLLNGAMLHAYMAHVYDFDDTHIPGMVHPSGPVWAAVVALAHRLSVTGLDALAAFVLGYEVEAMVAEDPTETLGVNSRADLARAENILRRRIALQVMEQGVTVIDPATTYIDKQVRIGKDSIIHPFTMLTGKVEIGEECVIGPHVQIADSKVGSGAHLQFCYVQEAELGNRVLVGPYALVRPGSRIADDTHIGTFVEVTRSRIGRGCDILHLSYIGDACIGDRVSLGTGTVTVNFDGTARRSTLIGDDVFLGSNTQLIAPVDVPSGVRYAHNAVLTGKVEQDAAPEDNGATDKAKRRRKKPAAL